MLLHVNVRPLHKNYDLFYELIKALQILPHAICIMKTRIKNQLYQNLTSRTIALFMLIQQPMLVE